MTPHGQPAIRSVEVKRATRRTSSRRGSAVMTASEQALAERTASRRHPSAKRRRRPMRSSPAPRKAISCGQAASRSSRSSSATTSVEPEAWKAIPTRDDRARSGRPGSSSIATSCPSRGDGRGLAAASALGASAASCGRRPGRGPHGTRGADAAADRRPDGPRLAGSKTTPGSRPERMPETSRKAAPPPGWPTVEADDRARLGARAREASGFQAR